MAYVNESAYGYGKGSIEKGIITGYDAETKTVIISPYDGRGLIEDVAIPMERNDDYNGSYAMTAPSIGSPCLFTQVNGEAFLVSMFPAVNLSPDGTDEYTDVINTSKNRNPLGMDADVQAGQKYVTNSNGAEVKFTENEAILSMVSGKLSAIFNMINLALDFICTKFSLRSGALNVVSMTDSGNAGNVTVDVRSSYGADVPTINISMGDEADVFNVNINDEFLIHIDSERNITIHGRNATIEVEDVDIQTHKATVIGTNLELTYDSIAVQGDETTMEGTNIDINYGTINLKGNVNVTGPINFNNTCKFDESSISLSGDSMNMDCGNMTFAGDSADFTGIPNIRGVRKS